MACCLVLRRQPSAAHNPLLTNRVLNQLPPDDRAALLAEAEHVVLRAGATFATAGEPIATAYFPDSGVLAYVSEMTTGHQLGVGAVGADGLIGACSLLGVPRHVYRAVALFDSAGKRISATALRRAFDRHHAVRAAALEHVGRQVIETASLVACTRVHSTRQRLARWLLLMMDKARGASLHVTHDVLAQLVGGPRHAVTVAVNELRAKGAITNLRGRIDILDHTLLAAHVCECYVPTAKLVEATRVR